jgi:hypothetical protein
VQHQAWQAQVLQGGRHTVRIQRQVHRITRLGVRQLKGQVRGCGQAAPGATQCNAGIGEVFQGFPRRGGDQGG